MAKIIKSRSECGYRNELTGLPADCEHPDGEYICHGFDVNCPLQDDQQQEKIHVLVEAMERTVANIEHWLETGESADEEESKSIYDQMIAALSVAKGDK